MARIQVAGQYIYSMLIILTNIKVKMKNHKYLRKTFADN